VTPQSAQSCPGRRKTGSVIPRVAMCCSRRGRCALPVGRSRRETEGRGCEVELRHQARASEDARVPPGTSSSSSPSAPHFSRRGYTVENKARSTSQKGGDVRDWREGESMGKGVGDVGGVVAVLQRAGQCWFWMQPALARITCRAPMIRAHSAVWRHGTLIRISPT
jgi:hypothetical protein